jgi:hypothetical protein
MLIIAAVFSYRLHHYMTNRLPERKKKCFQYEVGQVEEKEE